MKKIFALCVLCIFAATVCYADATTKFNPVPEEQVEAPTPTGTACACAKVEINQPDEVDTNAPDDGKDGQGTEIESDSADGGLKPMAPPQRRFLRLFRRRY